MKFKLDENLPASSAAVLARAGHDVDTVTAEGLTGAPDRDVVVAATAEGRILILWVPNILSPYATWAYSRIRPPSRSRRRTRTSGSIMGGRSRPAGGLWQSVRCGR